MNSEPDYITVSAVISPPGEYIVLRMSFNERRDEWLVKKTSSQLPLAAARRTAEMWAAALKLEVRGIPEVEHPLVGRSLKAVEDMTMDELLAVPERANCLERILGVLTDYPPYVHTAVLPIALGMMYATFEKMPATHDQEGFMSLADRKRITDALVDKSYEWEWKKTASNTKGN